MTMFMSVIRAISDAHGEEVYAPIIRDCLRTVDKEWTAGLRMTIDLGQGFEDRTEALARQAESASFRKRAAHAVREGQALNHELKHDLNTLGELIKTADQDVQVAESFLRLTENEYNRGVKNGPDLLEAVQKYFEFRDKRTDYYRDFYSTQAEIESLISKDPTK
jgi:outer membrane protein TolC